MPVVDPDHLRLRRQLVLCPNAGALARFFPHCGIVAYCGVTLRRRLALRDCSLATGGVVGLCEPDALRRRHFFWTFSSSALESGKPLARLFLFGENFDNLVEIYAKRKAGR